MNSDRTFRAGRTLLLLALAAAVVTPGFAQEPRKDRKAIQARVNKVWDQQLERMRRAKVEADCKAAAEKEYSAIRFNKRAQFKEECIKKASVQTPAPELHQAN